VTLGDPSQILTATQSYIADSTMEPKYVVAYEATKEVVWLRKFLMDLDVMRME